MSEFEEIRMTELERNDLTFMQRLTEAVGGAVEWHEYDYLPFKDGWYTGGYKDPKAQLEYVRSCGKKGNANANSPQVTPLDRIVENVCRLYQEATPAQRAVVRRALPGDAAFVLHHFAWRMAVRALRERSRQALTLALTAVSIEDNKGDFRDTIRSLALLYHVATRIGIEPEVLFHEAIRISTEGTGEMISSFLDRTADLKALWQYAFREGSGEHGATLEFMNSAEFEEVVRSHGTDKGA